MNGIDNDDLARILRSEEPLTPSSGFAAAVMERVHEAAAEPPPPAFPWARWAATAIACVTAAAAAATVLGTIDVATALAEPAATLQSAAPELTYAAAAALASCIIVRLPRLRRA